MKQIKHMKADMKSDELSLQFRKKPTMNIRLTFVAVLAVFAAVVSIIVAQPTAGNYPNRSIPLSTDTTVTPDAAPTNTTRITVSTSTNFKGKLEGDPTTGVVRVTDAHPAGTYR